MMNIENIAIRQNTKGLTSENLVNLWHGAGWVGFSDKYPRRLLEAMQRSDYLVTAWDGEELVGLCACMSNSLQVYVSQLCVTKEYQRSGIGRKLIGCVRQYYDDCEIILLTRKAENFYLKNGFSLDDDAIPMRVDNLRFELEEDYIEIRSD